MKTRALLGVVAITGAAFTAGMYWSGDTVAVAAPQHDHERGHDRAGGHERHSDMQADMTADMPADMAAKMEAWAKAGAVGEHHRHLDALVGEWHGTFKMWMEPGAEPMTTKGVIKREWVLGGRFLRETVHAMSDMGEFNGLGYIGWNNLDGRYEFVWMEDMSTSIMLAHGSFDPEEQTFHWSGAHRDPITGHMVQSWSTLEAPSPGHHVYSGWQVGADGRRFKNFAGEVDRK